MASVGDAPREFAGLHRTLQRLLAKAPAFYDGVTTARLIEAIAMARDEARDVDLTISTGAGPHRLLLRPILGPAGEVHALRMWLAAAATPIPPPRPAVGVIWDLETQTIQQPSGIVQLSGMSAEEYVPRTSIAELFQQMSTFDRHTEVLDLLYAPKPGDKLQFDVTITSEQGRSGKWRITIRARDDRRTRGAWLLIEDITSDQVPAEWPTLERTGLREAHRRAGTHLAVLHLERTSISHWLTDPAPWIRWDYLFRPIDVFHPDDRERLARLSRQLHAGDTLGTTVRTLNYAGGYTMTSLLLYPYPGYASTQLAIAHTVHIRDEVSSAEFGTVEPNMLPVPVGYDDQLRHRLAGRGRRIATL